MSEHTKGQVKYRGCETLAVVETLGGREAEPIAHCGGPNALGNARRLAALWGNAEGMDTKEIEQGMLLVNVRDKINAQARELTAARALLREVVEKLDHSQAMPEFQSKLQNWLDACDTLGSES